MPLGKWLFVLVWSWRILRVAGKDPEGVPCSDLAILRTKLTHVTATSGAGTSTSTPRNHLMFAMDVGDNACFSAAEGVSGMRSPHFDSLPQERAGEGGFPGRVLEARLRYVRSRLVMRVRDQYVFALPTVSGKCVCSCSGSCGALPPCPGPCMASGSSSEGPSRCGLCITKEEPVRCAGQEAARLCCSYRLVPGPHRLHALDLRPPEYLMDFEYRVTVQLPRKNGSEAKTFVERFTASSSSSRQFLVRPGPTEARVRVSMRSTSPARPGWYVRTGDGRVLPARNLNGRYEWDLDRPGWLKVAADEEVLWPHDDALRSALHASPTDCLRGDHRAFFAGVQDPNVTFLGEPDVPLVATLREGRISRASTVLEGSPVEVTLTTREVLGSSLTSDLPTLLDFSSSAEIHHTDDSVTLSLSLWLCRGDIYGALAYRSDTQRKNRRFSLRVRATRPSNTTRNVTLFCPGLTSTSRIDVCLWLTAWRGPLCRPVRVVQQALPADLTRPSDPSVTLDVEIDPDNGSSGESLW